MNFALNLNPEHRAFPSALILPSDWLKRTFGRLLIRLLLWNSWPRPQPSPVPYFSELFGLLRGVWVEVHSGVFSLLSLAFLPLQFVIFIWVKCFKC